MTIIPLAKQVIVQKQKLPKETKAFVASDPTLLGELCKVVSKGPDCRSDYNVGDYLIVLGGQIFSVPELQLEWVHDDAVLMIIKDYDNGRQKE